MILATFLAFLPALNLNQGTLLPSYADFAPSSATQFVASIPNGQVLVLYERSFDSTGSLDYTATGSYWIDNAGIHQESITHSIDPRDADMRVSVTYPDIHQLPDSLRYWRDSGSTGWTLTEEFLSEDRKAGQALSVNRVSGRYPIFHLPDTVWTWTDSMARWKVRRLVTAEIILDSLHWDPSGKPDRASRTVWRHSAFLNHEDHRYLWSGGNLLADSTKFRWVQSSNLDTTWSFVRTYEWNQGRMVRALWENDTCEATWGTDGRPIQVKTITWEDGGVRTNSFTFRETKWNTAGTMVSDYTGWPDQGDLDSAQTDSAGIQRSSMHICWGTSDPMSPRSAMSCHETGFTRTTRTFQPLGTLPRQPAAHAPRWSRHGSSLDFTVSEPIDGTLELVRLDGSKVASTRIHHGQAAVSAGMARGLVFWKAVDASGKTTATGTLVADIF